MPKILIVDDEPFIRQLLELTLEDLEDEGVDLLFAANGDEALDLIKKERPCLVFLDVMMPKMNGFEVCDIVKNELGMTDTYIVLLTAKGQEFDKEKGREVGSDRYMTKPFNPDEVLAKARKIISRQQPTA
jgi:two-component system alkaline phosphatase synthesis response regulator PhoP